MFHWIPVSPTRYSRCRGNNELGHENDGGASSFPNDRKIGSDSDHIFHRIGNPVKQSGDSRSSPLFPNKERLCRHVLLDSRVPQVVIPAVAEITTWRHENDESGSPHRQTRKIKSASFPNDRKIGSASDHIFLRIGNPVKQSGDSRSSPLFPNKERLCRHVLLDSRVPNSLFPLSRK